MYNSRPRSIGYERYSNSFAVPENYSGSAFRGDIATDLKPELKEVEDSFAENEAESVEQSFDDEPVQGPESIDAMGKQDTPLHISKKPFASRLGFGFNVGKLFGGSFGIEELLLIGLILLISQSDNNEDIIALLVLLLFIG